MDSKTFKEYLENFKVKEFIEAKDFIGLYKFIDEYGPPNGFDWWDSLLSKLTKLNVNVVNVNQSIPSYFALRSPIEKLTIPEGVEVIGQKAFGSCKLLKEISFPKSLTEIKYRAFEGCESLTEVLLEHCTNLIEIGEGGFHYCKSIEKVTLPGSIGPLRYQVFGGCDKLNKIVYRGTMEDFKRLTELSNWKTQFKSIRIICNDGRISIR